MKTSDQRVRSLAPRQPTARATCATVLIGIATIACTPLPRDPERTLEHVLEQHHMRVGLVESPPWVVRNGTEPGGVEVELARQFAKSLGAAPEWFWGNEQKHMEALEKFELELVLSGLDADTPWSKKIGLTRPYFRERVIVGLPPGTIPPRTLNGMKVAVETGQAIAASLIREHATPVRVSSLSRVTQPVAAPDWRVEKMAFTPTQFRLQEKKHVFASPPGENGWLKRVGDFLQSQQSSVKDLLLATEVQQ